MPDGDVPLEAVLRHLRDIVEATDLPVSADFESGFGRDPEGVAASVRRCLDTGVAGLSIEDATGDPARPLFELPAAVERVRAARAAVDASGTGAVLVARAECFLTGHPDPLGEALRRLAAYADAGADCRYAPGLRTGEQAAEIVKAVAPRPVNVLVASPWATVNQLADLGVRRISVGGALARAALAAFRHAAEEIARSGTFGALGAAPSNAQMKELFRPYAARTRG